MTDVTRQPRPPDRGQDGVEPGQDPADAKRSPLGGAIVLVLLIVLLAAAAGGAWYLWAGMGDTPIGTQGLIALALGGTVTLLLGAGLTTLIIISSRRGYDEGAGRDDQGP